MQLDDDVLRKVTMRVSLLCYEKNAYSQKLYVDNDANRSVMAMTTIIMMNVFVCVYGSKWA